MFLTKEYISDAVYASVHLSADGAFFFPSPQALVLCLSLLIRIMETNLSLFPPHSIRPADDAAKGLCKPYRYIKSRPHTPGGIVNYYNPLAGQCDSSIY